MPAGRRAGSHALAEISSRADACSEHRAAPRNLGTPKGSYAAARGARVLREDRTTRARRLANRSPDQSFDARGRSRTRCPKKDRER